MHEDWDTITQGNEAPPANPVIVLGFPGSFELFGHFANSGSVSALSQVHGLSVESGWMNLNPKREEPAVRGVIQATTYARVMIFAVSN